MFVKGLVHEDLGVHLLLLQDTHECVLVCWYVCRWYKVVWWGVARVVVSVNCWLCKCSISTQQAVLVKVDLCTVDSVGAGSEPVVSLSVAASGGGGGGAWSCLVDGGKLRCVWINSSQYVLAVECSAMHAGCCKCHVPLQLGWCSVQFLLGFIFLVDIQMLPGLLYVERCMTRHFLGHTFLSVHLHCL